MGACLDYRSYSTSLPKEIIEEKWESEKMECSLLHGIEYSGSINMLEGKIAWIADLILDDEEEAENWLSKNHKKWEPPYAIRYRKSRIETVWIIGGWCSS